MFRNARKKLLKKLSLPQTVRQVLHDYNIYEESDKEDSEDDETLVYENALKKCMQARQDRIRSIHFDPNDFMVSDTSDSTLELARCASPHVHSTLKPLQECSTPLESMIDDNSINLSGLLKPRILNASDLSAKQLAISSNKRLSTSLKRSKPESFVNSLTAPSPTQVDPYLEPISIPVLAPDSSKQLSRHSNSLSKDSSTSSKRSPHSQHGSFVNNLLGPLAPEVDRNSQFNVEPILLPAQPSNSDKQLFRHSTSNKRSSTSSKHSSRLGHESFVNLFPEVDSDLETGHEQNSVFTYRDEQSSRRSRSSSKGLSYSSKRSSRSKPESINSSVRSSALDIESYSEPDYSLSPDQVSDHDKQLSRHSHSLSKRSSISSSRSRPRSSVNSSVISSASKTNSAQPTPAKDSESNQEESRHSTSSNKRLSTSLSSASRSSSARSSTSRSSRSKHGSIVNSLLGSDVGRDLEVVSGSEPVPTFETLPESASTNTAHNVSKPVADQVSEEKSEPVVERVSLPVPGTETEPVADPVSQSKPEPFVSETVHTSNNLKRSRIPIAISTPAPISMRTVPPDELFAKVASSTSQSCNSPNASNILQRSLNASSIKLPRNNDSNTSIPSPPSSPGSPYASPLMSPRSLSSSSSYSSSSPDRTTNSRKHDTRSILLRSKSRGSTGSADSQPITSSSNSESNSNSERENESPVATKPNKKGRNKRKRGLPNDEDEAPRRSQRNKMKPLEFWRGELPIYKLEPNGTRLIIGVTKGASPDFRKRKVLRRNPIKRVKQDRFNLSTHVPLNQSCIERSDKAKDKMKGLTLLQNLKWNVSKASQNVFIASIHESSSETRKRGFIKIMGNHEKPSQSTGSYDSDLMVVDGKVSVTIGDSVPIILSTGDAFSIPPFTYYSIRNLRNDDAFLSFYVFSD